MTILNQFFYDYHRIFGKRSIYKFHTAHISEQMWKEMLSLQQKKNVHTHQCWFFSPQMHIRSKIFFFGTNFFCPLASICYNNMKRMKNIRIHMRRAVKMNLCRFVSSSSFCMAKCTSISHLCSIFSHVVSAAHQTVSSWQTYECKYTNFINDYMKNVHTK